MVEISRPYTTNGIGHGPIAGYSDAQWWEVWRTLIAPATAHQGVFIDQLNQLDANIRAAFGFVDINTGRAMVDGTWYQSDAIVPVNLPVPAAGQARIDRIVIRRQPAITNAATIARIVGAEAINPVPPVIVQVPGGNYDLPLWQVFVSQPLATAYLLQDERSWIGQYEPARITDGFHVFDDDFHFGNVGNVFTATQYGPWQCVLANSVIAGTYIDGIGEFAFTDSAAGLGHAVIHTITNLRPVTKSMRIKSRIYTTSTNANWQQFIGWFSAFPSGAVFDPNDGIYWRQTGAAGPAAAAWTAVCRVGGVETAIASTQQAVAAYHIFEIRCTPDAIGGNVISFWIDGAPALDAGGLPIRITTNIPAAVNLLISIGEVQSAAAGGASMVADYIKQDGLR